ncbi:MAG TPA: DoxX family protein [Candidatus Nanoarchaeia archaeon]|nr:DoxX family protein [Candidatus Nanoarchaeia archaeon]
MGKLNKLSEKGGSWFYLLFRLLVGVLFFLHGLSKFGGGQAPGTLFLVAGVLELVIGAGVFLGLFTRGLALVGAVEMLVAYFIVHTKNGLNPLVNQGELAVLFFAAFLVLLTYGAQKWCLEQKLLNKEVF